MVSIQLPKTYHVFYAWAEGKWQGKAMEAALKKAGFVEAPCSDATVLIAHSVGCYLITPSEKNKVIIIIDPPYWPGKSITLRLLKKVWHDHENSSILYWFEKIFWNTVYIVTKPSINVRSFRAVHVPDPFATISERATIVRNERDFFCTPELAELVKNRVVSLPGLHDDCWHNPAPYVALIQSEYELANKT